MIKINRKELEAEIKKMIRVVPNSSTIPIIKGLLIECGNNNMKITATNLEMTIATDIYCQTDMFEEKYVIEAKIFYDIINKLSAEEVEINYSSEEGMIDIKGGKAKFKIKEIGKVDAFPCFDSGLSSKTKEIKIEAATFKSLVAKTVPFVLDDNTRPVLEGVKLEFTKNKVKGISLDGYRLSFFTSEVENDNNVNFIIPSVALVNISRTILDENVILTYSEEVKNLKLSIEKTTIYVKQIEGNFIDYEKVLNPQNYRSKLTVKTNELKSSIDRLNILARTVGGFSPIKISIEAEKLLLQAKNEVGALKEEVKIEIEGEEDIKIAFNPKYLLEGLNAADGENVELRINDSTSAAYILDNNYIYLVLPVRLGENEL